MKTEKFIVQITSSEKTRWFHDAGDIARRIEYRIAGMVNAMTEGAIPQVTVAPVTQKPETGDCLSHPDNCQCPLCGK
jgi:hypothetical protein